MCDFCGIGYSVNEETGACDANAGQTAQVVCPPGCTACVYDNNLLDITCSACDASRNFVLGTVTLSQPLMRCVLALSTADPYCTDGYNVLQNDGTYDIVCTACAPALAYQASTGACV